jgi:hypothetical protein
MKDLIPVCVNCKYFLSEPTGVHRLKSGCAISAIDPVTGEPTGKVKHAGQYRKENGICGPVGKFFEAGKAKPKKEEPKPVVKTVKVETPVIEEEKEEPKDGELLPLEPGKKRRRRAK